MPCDGKNPNCDRRRELLAQLKCLISSMDRKKPCEWDESLCPPMVYCPGEVSSCIQPCEFIKPCKTFDFRGSVKYRCECIKRNGLQDRCMMWDCMGRPECMTKLYPVCEPGRAALLKLTDLGDAEVALRKFYCADQAREAALAAYCRLTCDKGRQRQILSCNNEILCAPPIPCARTSDTLNDNDNNLWCKSFCVPSVHPNYMLESCNVCCPPRKLEEFCFSYGSPSPMCLPSYPSTYLSCSAI